jgi:hypothetical protein
MHHDALDDDVNIHSADSSVFPLFEQVSHTFSRFNGHWHGGNILWELSSFSENLDLNITQSSCQNLQHFGNSTTRLSRTEWL